MNNGEEDGDLTKPLSELGTVELLKNTCDHMIIRAGRMADVTFDMQTSVKKK